MRRFPLLWLLAALPLLVGIGAVIYFQSLQRVQPIPILIFRVDVRSAILILAGLLSGVLFLFTGQAARASERSQAEITENQLEQERKRRRFLRRLDHELKNPLTAMRAALANLTDTAGSQEQVHLVQDVQHQVERLSQLVGDLRKLAELEERPLEALPVDLNELLNEVVENALSQPAYQGRNVHLVIANVPWPLPRVTGDRDLLWLVFYNLIDNALKYTRAENVVEVRAQEDGHAVTVEVADNGQGIPPEDLERIFEELYRGVNARGIEGSGLGLALAYRIVQRHGGAVAVRSRRGASAAHGAQGESAGTVFTVRLPLSR